MSPRPGSHDCAANRVPNGQEAGLWDRLELFNATVAPTMKETPTDKANPLAKVPALETPFGTMYDSPVICAYLDSLSTSRKFIPAGEARWTALTMEALADGILDAAILVRYEGFLRPEEKRWNDWVDGQMRKIQNALNDLESKADTLKGPADMTIGEVTVVCAIG